MVGYTRQDNTGEIANNEVIDADDLNAEFNAVKVAFQGAGGHNHDPSSSDSGAPVEKVGPAGQITVNATQVLPNGDNTIDLGGSPTSARFKNGFFGTKVTAPTIDGDTLKAGSSGYMTLTDNELDVSSGDLLVDVAGDMTVDVAGGNILLKDAEVDFGSLNNVSGNMTIKSGTTDALQFTGANADFQGTLDVTLAATLDNNLTVLGDVDFSNSTVGGTFSVTPPSTFTGLVTGNGGFSGLLTGNVKGDVLATDGTVVLQNGTDGSDAALTGTVSSLSNHDTDDLSEGSTNLYYTSTRADSAAKGAISVTDSGGDGSLAYNSTTGVITYTGPSATDTRAHFSGGTGVSISSGEISIGQEVATTDDVTFNDLTVDGDLTVGGTTTTVNSTTVTVDDPIFTLGGDTAPTADDNKDRGIEFNWHNGTAAKLGFFGFDDSSGKFTFIPDATNTSEVFTGTAGTVVASTFEGNVVGQSMTSSTDITLDADGGDFYFADDGDTKLTFVVDGGSGQTISSTNSLVVQGGNATNENLTLTTSGRMNLNASGEAFGTQAGIALQGTGAQRGVIDLSTASQVGFRVGTGNSPSEELRLTTSGVGVLGGLRVGDTTAPTDNDIYAVADIEAGSDVIAGGEIKLTAGASDWSFEVQTSNNILVVKYNGGGLFKIDTSGNVTAKGDITAFGNF